MKWISVEERLPPEGKEVLVSGDGRVTIGRRHKTVWLMDEEEFVTNPIKKIAAWTPLPKPFNASQSHHPEKSEQD